MSFAELSQVQRERDLYWRLLQLGVQEDLTQLLKEALALIVEVTNSKKGYLALFENSNIEEPQFEMAHSCSQEEITAIQRKISQGIIKEALSTNKTINTASAQDDPRFQDNSSVLRHEIQEVLCVPVVLSAPLGVLYLQDKTDESVFSEEDRQRAETFARHFATSAERLLTLRRLREVEDSTETIRRRLKIGGIIGKSRALAETLKQVESAARFDISLLLLGPSGTGKTALARAIHDNSQRAGKPFIELNCAALPEALFESELFGAMQGAHSTATRRIYGKLFAAQGGTLFLDEIGELSLSIQSKLLQLLQSKEYFPLGATKAEKADVRLIAATNQNLPEAIAKKSFREDLFYRLKVLTIRVPSLSERKEDIPLLVEHFCKEACVKYDLPALTISSGVLAAASEVEWPGNIRQLANDTEAAVIKAVAEGSGTLETQHLFQEQAPEGGTLSFQEATRRFQRRYLLEALEATHWNLSEVSRRLSLARSHVHTLLQSFDLRHLDPRKKT